MEIIKKLNSWVFYSFFIFIFLTTINAQFQDFHSSDSSSSSLKMDPLRKVFGIWGRLLNRMAQPSPPTDDELHLKGLQEEAEKNDNFIEDSDWNKRIAGEGDKNKKVLVPNIGTNRIIDEVRLNQLLPRFNMQSTTTINSITSTTTNNNNITQELTTIKKEKENIINTTIIIPTKSTDLPIINSTIQENTKLEELKKKKIKKVKRKNLLKTITPSLKTTLKPEEEKEKQYNIRPTNSSKLEENENKDIKKEENPTATNYLEKILKENEILISSPISVNQSESVKLNENEIIGLTKMENETAQLIAAIENVLADAEVGPNARGYWLHETAITTTTMSNILNNFNETKITTNTSEKEKQDLKEIKKNIITQKTEKEEEDKEEEEESEEDEETEETDQELLETKENLLLNVTTIINKFNNLTTKNINNKIEENNNTTKTSVTITTKIPSLFEKSLKKKGVIKFIPEAEEEEQAADIASLQLDSVASPVLPKSNSFGVFKTFTSLPENGKTVVPNIFILQPNNSTMPNFSTMIKPVNSIIDGIGPLILPLIGYSRQALDSYSLTNNLLPGVPSRQQSEIRSSPSIQQRQQQQQRSLIEEILSRPFVSPLFPSPFITQQNEGEKQQKEQEQQKTLSEPPSLELLDKIVEQRRQRENAAHELMMKRMRENNPINIQNTIILTSTTTSITFEQPSADSGNDSSGRNIVLNNFHEDSGLIRKNEQTQQQQQLENQGQPPPSAQRPQVVFGNGKRPSSFLFLKN